VDVDDLSLLIQNFDMEGDADPAPPLLTFAITPGPLTGGQPINALATFAEPVPAGATLTIASSPGNAVRVPGMNPTTVTLQEDQTTPYEASFSLNTSTVNYPTTATVFATYQKTTRKATTALTPLNLRVVWLKPEGAAIRIRLEWEAFNTSNNLLLKRTVNGQTTVLPSSGTLSGSATSYEDTFNYFAFQPANPDCFYELCEDLPSPNQDRRLATEKVKFYQVAAEANQAVDSRLDKRYAVETLLDFKFGTRTYNGGLFAGYKPETGTEADNSRTGRSLARFPSAARSRTWPSDAARSMPISWDCTSATSGRARPTTPTR
jgi:hypothetical protein